MSSISRDSTLPSFGERRGHRLAPLQTNFSRPAGKPDLSLSQSQLQSQSQSQSQSQAQTQAQSQSQSQSHQPKTQPTRLQRPRPTDPVTNGSEGPVPLQSPVKRQSSKSSLRNIFARDKGSSRAMALGPESKLDEIEETQTTASSEIITPQIATIDETILSPSIATPHTTVSSSTTLTSPTTPRARNTLKTGRPRPPELKSSQDQYGWKPPALFQAYPQSTKHDCLSAPAMSADSILRLHATTGKNVGEDGRVGTSGQDSKKKEQKERKHLRTLSGTINKVEWTKKIYVLATAGFILQYAGEGKHDRLPERMLQLGPHSVAFASDAIPGKHWVVQISQNPAADSVPVPEPPKPRLSSRFGFHRSHARRLAQSFLMVFDDPDSMISWLMAIRAEVEARGGPKFTMEKHSENEVEPQLRSKASVRQMVKKDPNRISSLFLQPQTLRFPDDDEDGQSAGAATWQSRRSSYVSDNRRSIIDSRAGSTSTGRTEATPPMNNDASSLNFSSFNTTASLAPEYSEPLTPYGVPEAVLREVDQMIGIASPTSSQGYQRQSLYMSPLSSPPPSTAASGSASASVSASASTPRTESASVNQPSSNVPETLVRSASPPAPNFSVPSFSKKFVARQGSVPANSASSPPSVERVLRRGESTSDITISTISSPPQSPTYSVASSRHTDSSEPVPMPRDSNGRVLRTYNSEDVLSRMVRTTQPAPNFSRVPRGRAPSETSPPPSRPLSLVGRPGLGIQLNGDAHPPIPPPVESTMKADLQAFPQPGTAPVPAPAPALTTRNRNPPTQSDSHMTPSMSRRRSMPGLAVGPPAAPPPNCPLPKLPPAAIKPPPPPSTAPAPPMKTSTSPTKPSPTSRFYQSQQLQDSSADKRRSGVPEKHTKAAARQSRML